MPELVGFQIMVIQDPNGMSFDAVCIFGLDYQLLFKSNSSYCETVVTKLFTCNSRMCFARNSSRAISGLAFLSGLVLESSSSSSSSFGGSSPKNKDLFIYPGLSNKRGFLDKSRQEC